MPKRSSNVLSTDREVKAASSLRERTDYRVSGVRGLQLRVTPGGTKSWVLAFKSTRNGNWSKILIGHYPEVSLANARDKAESLSSRIRDGFDPTEDTPEERWTFGCAAAAYLAEHKIKNARGEKISRTTLEAARILRRDVLPSLESVGFDQVTRRQISDLIEQIAARGAFVASDRALGLVRAIYNWGCATGKCEADPTSGLRKRNTSRPKTRVLSRFELGRLWHCLEVLPGISWQLRDALRIQILTGVRISEIVTADRGEFDTSAAIWTIPAERTKGHRKHIVPLSALALRIVEQVLQRAEFDGSGVSPQSSDPLFKARFQRGRSERRTNCMDPHSATRCINRLRPALVASGIIIPFNTHDLRRTFATHLGEMGIDDATISKLLNHAPQSMVRRHYNHSSNLEHLRTVLERWASELQVIINFGSGDEVADAA